MHAILNGAANLGILVELALIALYASTIVVTLLLVYLKPRPWRMWPYTLSGIACTGVFTAIAVFFFLFLWHHQAHDWRVWSGGVSALFLVIGALFGWTVGRWTPAQPVPET